MLALWQSLGSEGAFRARLDVGFDAYECMAVGGVERPHRAVRFARLIHRPVRVLGGPSARAAFGGNLHPALIAAQGAMALHRSIDVEDSSQPEAKMAAGRNATAPPPDECWG